ncbi:hypothetical protein GCM10009817_16920 [Terrabacter lapilli]|uniref:Uncharacterized protein n=1 Tax=Terrabacter lapilli TaxID=436231 RepID=A0ABN2RYD6_9MICO
MNEQQLIDRLTSLGDQAPPPSTPVTDDIARGVRNLHRQRIRAGLGGLVAAGTVVCAFAVGSSLLHGAAANRSDAPAAASRSAVTVSSLLPAGGGLAPAPTTPSGAATEPEPSLGTRASLVAALRHLDPDGRHLDATDLGSTQLGWGYDGRGLTSVELSVRWHEPGQSAVGTARVQVWRDPFVCTMRPPNPNVKLRCQTVMLGTVKATKVQYVYENQDPSAADYYVKNSSGAWVSGYVVPTYGPSRTTLPSVTVTPAQLGAMLSDPGLAPLTSR